MALSIKKDLFHLIFELLLKKGKVRIEGRNFQFFILEYLYSSIVKICLIKIRNIREIVNKCRGGYIIPNTINKSNKKGQLRGDCGVG